MSKRSFKVYSIAVLFLMICSPLGAVEWLQGGPKPNQSAVVSDACANYAPFSGPASGPGSTSGRIDTFTEGDYFVFSATGNGTGSWRIVDNPSGSNTLASGGRFPGTLVYEVPEGETLPGAGFYVDSYSGSGDTITGDCGNAPGPIPTLSEWSLILLVALLAFIGFAVYTRQRAT